MPRRDLGYNQASRPNYSTDAKCRQCRESNPEPRRLRRSFSSPDPCLVRRILTGLDQPTSDAVAGDVPTTCGRLPRGFHRRVGVTGFEPATFRPQTGRATKLRHTPMLPSHVLASARPGFARRPIGSRRCLPGFACQRAAGCPVGSGAVLTAHAPTTGVSGGAACASFCSLSSCQMSMPPVEPRPILTQGWQDSNLQRAALETAVLPVELHPYVQLFVMCAATDASSATSVFSLDDAVRTYKKPPPGRFRWRLVSLRVVRLIYRIGPPGPGFWVSNQHGWPTMPEKVLWRAEEDEFAMSASSSYPCFLATTAPPVRCVQAFCPASLTIMYHGS